VANESSKIDSNQKHCLMGVTNSATPELRNLKVDPTTGRLLVSAIIAAGAGTVTNVSVVDANGISGTVADPTTTPAISLSLDAITPTSVNGLTLASQATGFTIAGGTTSKTLTIQGDVTITGALGSAAYTASTDYADASHASQHAVGGSDTIFPADPGADKYLMWDDDTGALVWADAAAGGGASTALDNLLNVAINTSLISDTDEIDDLGSTTKKWNNLFVKTIELGHASDTTLSRSAAGVLAVEGTAIPKGTGTANEIAYWSGTNTIASLPVATYPTITELSYVKGVTSAIQTQIGNKANSASPTFTGTVTLADNCRIDLTLPTADGYATGPTTDSFASGYSSSVGDLVFFGTGGKWLECDADAIATCGTLLGIALEAKSDGQAMKVALPGSMVRIDAWNWNVGKCLYASETLGALSESIPTGADGVVKVVGVSLSADAIYFYPSQDHSTTVA